MQNKINTYHLLLSLAIFLLSPPQTIARNYTPNSILKDGNWVKIRVAQSGICKITYNQIQSMGLDPTQIRIYGFGGAQINQDLSKKIIDDLPPVPIYFYKGADNTFNNNDFILFYAQGPEKWQFDGNNFTHTLNTYSSHGYYFLTDNAGIQLPIENTTLHITKDETKTTVISTFTEHTFHEQDIINLVDITGQSGGGKTFYGEKINNNATLSLPISIKNLTPNSTLEIKCDIAASASANVLVTLNANGANKSTSLRPLNRNGSYTEQATTATLSGSFPVNNSDKQNISISVKSDYAPAAAYLNFIEITSTCNLTFENSFMTFRTTSNFQSNTPNQYILSNTKNTTQVWDITDLDSIRQVTTTFSNNQLSFIGSNQEKIREYVALDPLGDNFVPFTFDKKIANQNLHNQPTPCDILIITPTEFVEQAQQLAHLHEIYDNLHSVVMTDEAIFNEFSSGTPDASAYRLAAKMLYDKNSTKQKKLSYLILFGDGSFDNRHLLPNSGNHNLLTFQADNSVDEVKAYASDDFFGILGDESGKNIILDTMCIAIGRLPANSQLEASEIVNKIEYYLKNKNTGTWKNQLLFLADDGDAGQHIMAADDIAETIRTTNPNFIVNKIYLDAFQQNISASGESYPMVNNKLHNLLSSGILFFNYSGHGSASAITNEKTLLYNDITTMNNPNLGFWMLATCSFSHFDGNIQSAAESALLNPNGGAIAVLSATRTVYANQNNTLNKFFCESLFEHQNEYSYNTTIGKATQIAKNKCTKINMSTAENKMAFVLLGDPALKLNFPTQNKISLKSKKDTIKALDVDTITGYIAKPKPDTTITPQGDTITSDTLSNFNGKVYLTILDKMNQYQTFDNDETSEDKKQKILYNDYLNTIYKGTATVTNGKFSLVYRIPKDIQYNYAPGRIVAYAFDSTTLPNNIREASGYNENFIIGGSSTLNTTDTQGPLINLYLNSKSFQNGGTTFQSPRFYADIYDDNGINTSGTGIGHDLLLTIDNDPNQTFYLNEYFSSTEDSYQQGQVNFLLSNLNEGKHTLSFRAWDMLNNSSTATLDFIITNNANPQLYSFSAYPNPVSKNGILHFYLDYDRTEYPCNITLLIYNLAGQLIHTQKTTNTTPIQCDLSQINVNAGVYLYKFMINAPNTKITTKTGKVIVK